MSAPDDASTGATQGTTPSRRRRALTVLAIETGGCGACAQSIAALRAPGFAPALSAEGITFASSPRHADVLLVAGPLSAAARDAVQQIIEGAPLPRALVAVGDCAIEGCVFASSPHITTSVADDLDVNVEIAGCPPSPDAILAAIGEAARLLAGADTTPPDDGSSEDESDADTLDEEGSDA
jgi:formate hydrogenlyase subunit 7